MKVLNLCCALGHHFEGWFASEADYADQGERGLIACPICEDKTISRLPTAPRLNMTTQRGDAAPTAGRAPAPMPAAAGQAGQADAVALRQGRLLDAVRELMARTEDVGDRFPEEARRIHYGEVEERGIRGHASADEAQALRDEGIEFVSVGLPFKGPVQ